MFSWQGLILFLGACYGIYLTGVLLRELTNDAKESIAIWLDDRKNKQFKAKPRLFLCFPVGVFAIVPGFQ
jgi:hypothetical protein